MNVFTGMNHIFAGIRGERKAQATTEIAVVGAFAIIVFALVLQYGQTMNRQQALQMYAFRKALEKSRDKNKEITYTVIRDGLVFSPAQLIKGMSTARVSASSTVVAVNEEKLFFKAESKEAKDSREYYNINGQEFEVEPIKVKIDYGGDKENESYIAAPLVDVAYTTNKDVEARLEKSEQRTSGISTSYSYAIGASGTTSLKLFPQSTFEQDYLDDLHDQVSEHKEEARWEKEKRLEGYWNVIWMSVESTIESIIAEDSAGALVSAAVVAATGIISVLFGEILGDGQEPPEAKDAKTVKVTSGYRSEDSVSSEASFSGGSTFDVQ